MPQVQQGSVRFNSSEEEPHPSPFPFLLYTCSMIRQYLCFRCRNSLAARVQTSVRAEVRAAPTVLQSGDPNVIFIYHTHCKDYSTLTVLHCTTHCTAPTPHCSVFLSALLHTPLKHLTHSRAICSLLSNFDA